MEPNPFKRDERAELASFMRASACFVGALVLFLVAVYWRLR